MEAGNISETLVYTHTHAIYIYIYIYLYLLVFMASYTRKYESLRLPWLAKYPFSV